MILSKLRRLVSFLFNFSVFANEMNNVKLGKNTNVAPLYKLHNVEIGDFSYISTNSRISYTRIGKFCSFGPNLLCGYGIHPTNGISSSPVFYAKKTVLGLSFSESNKIQERKEIVIGNDVFIGANVIILDGVTIGNGAVIGAGAVVSKNIPAYAVAIGCPIRVIKYRFEPEIILKLENINWWDKGEEVYNLIEKYFFDVQIFLKAYDAHYMPVENE